MAYYMLEPFGNEDLQNGMTRQLIAAVNTPKDKPRPKLDDFRLGRDAREQTETEQAAALYAQYLAGGGERLPEIEEMWN